MLTYYLLTLAIEANITHLPKNNLA